MNQLSVKKIIVALCAPFLFVACGNDITEEIPEVEIVKDGVKWTRPELQLAVALPQTDENATRVVLVDGKYVKPESSGVKATWQTTDTVGVWNITAAAGGQNGYNTVHPNLEGQYTQFAGTVNCQKGDRIAVFYPYGGGITASSDGILKIDLKKQKGTLEDIAKNYDLVYGEATVRNVVNGEASAGIGMMSAGITILELQFTDADNGDSLIIMERLQIKVDGGSNEATLNLNNLSAGLTMVTSSKEEVVDTFDICLESPSRNVYVAMFGASAGKTFHFSIIDQFGFQHKASATAPLSLTAGQITRATRPAKDGDYIEFDKVKFAKGNLIWDEGSVADAMAVGRREMERTLTRDSWFIAPSQEWSPEQLTDPRLGNFTPVWPVAAPKHQSGIDQIYTVPNPSAGNFYISTFLLGVAGLNGACPGLGYIISQTSSTTTGGNMPLLFIQATFDKDTCYQKQLWGNVYLDGTWDLNDALNNGNQTRNFFGDQAYLATGGQYAMPTVKELEIVFRHPNAVWAVIPVSKNGQNNIKPIAGSKGSGVPANSDYYNMDPDILPIYGLYVDKTRTYDDMKAKTLYTGTEWGDRKPLVRQKAEYYAYKGCAVVLTEDDLKRGIFLPADGIRTHEMNTGSFEYITGYMGGEYCSYLTATFGKQATASDTKIGRHWTARADNHGRFEAWGNDDEPDVKIEFKNEFRNRTGSIRPVYIGDIFK